MRSIETPRMAATASRELTDLRAREVQIFQEYPQARRIQERRLSAGFVILYRIELRTAPFRCSWTQLKNPESRGLKPLW